MRVRVRIRVRMKVRISECGRKIRNANRIPKSDDRTESNLRKGRREGGKVGGKQGGRGERRWDFDLTNQGLRFAPDRKKPCYRKSNSS